MSAIRTVVQQKNPVAYPVSQGPFSVVLTLGSKGEPGAAGAPGAPGATGPQGPSGAGTSAINIFYCGGSSTARQNVIIPTANSPGRVVGDGSKLTMTLTQDWLIQGGELATMSAPSFGAPFDQTVAWGPLTKESATVVSLPYSGPAGSSTDQWHLLLANRFSPHNGFREINSLAGGMLRMVGNFSTGSTNAQQLERRIPTVAASSAHVAAGSFGSGNSRLGGYSAQSTADCIGRMFQVLKAAGKFMLLELPSATANRTPADVAWGAELTQRLRILRAAEPMFDFIDPNDFTILPSTSQAIPAILRNSIDENIHPGREFWTLCAPYTLAILRRWFTIPASETVLQVMSMDRYSQEPSGGTNICEAGWSASGQAAAALDSKASGTVWNEVGNMFSSGSAGRSGLWSIVEIKRPDGTGSGMYELVGNLTAGAAGDLFRLDITNAGAALLKDRMPIGSKWIAGMVAGVFPGTAIVREYNIGVFGILTFPVLGDKAVKMAMAIDNLTEKVEGVLKHAWDCPMHTPEFTVSTQATANAGTALRFEVVLDTAGTAQVRLRMPTVRPVF